MAVLVSATVVIIQGGRVEGRRAPP
jgi:hypothetical protein